MLVKKKNILSVALFSMILFINIETRALAENTNEVAVFYEDENGEVKVEFYSDETEEDTDISIEQYNGLKIEYNIPVEITKDTVYNRLKILANTNQRTDRNKEIKNILNTKELKAIDIIPEAWNKGSYIVINTDKLILTYYKDGKIIEKYPIAAGKIGRGKRTVTPNMSKTVITKVVNPYWNGMNRKYRPVKGGAPNNPLGKRWIGLDREYGIHGTNNERSIGTFASHGCIRMFNKDVKELFKKVEIGTTVIVGSESYLKENGIVQVGGK